MNFKVDDVIEVLGRPMNPPEDYEEWQHSLDKYIGKRTKILRIDGKWITICDDEGEEVDECLLACEVKKIEKEWDE